MSYDHVIFDNDGVLLDSTTENLQWMEKFRINQAEKMGGQMTPEQSEKIFKATKAEEIRELAEETGLTVEKLRKIEVRKSQKKIRKIKRGEIGLFDSAEEILKKIQRPKSMVSNAPWKATQFSLKHCNLRKHFKTVRSPRLDSLENYIEKKKPSPQMIQKTIKEKASENPVYIGDSETDIIAAEKAGIDSIYINRSGKVSRDPTFSVEKLDEVLDILR